MAAVPPGRPELEQEVAVSGGIIGTDGKLKDPEEKEEGRIPAAATSKGLFPQRRVGGPLTRIPEERASCARCGTCAIGSPSLA